MRTQPTTTPSTTSTTSTWNPDQYHRFADQRRRPFDDLLALLRPASGARVVDLGCGTGELTVDLHRHLGAAATVGVDSSASMLERAQDHAGDGVSFELGDLGTWAAAEPVDVVFANASLHWVPDHPALLARLAANLTPGGQLAFQVPSNHDHPAHTVAEELGAERGLHAVGAAASVLTPAEYATILWELGLEDLHVRLQVYGFALDRTEDVVEWTKGTLLTGYKDQLSPEAYDDFEAEYRRRVVAAIGEHAPYFYAFKRILAYGHT